MKRKTLLALAVAGALGASGAAFAGSGGHHSSYDSSTTMSLSDSSWTHGDSMSLHMSDELAYSGFDDSFATGSSSSEGAGGTLAFSSEGTSELRDPSTFEVYLVPAPLAANDGTQFWVETLEPTADAIDRIATENVYVMTPIEDAIVDPRLVLTEGPDAITMAQMSDSEYSVS